AASATRPRLVARLDNPGRARPGADAHGHHAVTGTASQHLVGDGADHARARHAERVPDRDRAAVDVQVRRIEAERVAAVDDLRGEGLVQLPDVDVLYRQPMALQ